MMLNRVNRAGVQYRLSEVFGPTSNPKVSIRTGNKQMILTGITIQQMNQGWYNWMVEDMFIQDAFPFMTRSEREFLQTGILPDEWDAIFKDKDAVRGPKVS